MSIKILDMQKELENNKFDLNQGKKVYCNKKESTAFAKLISSDKALPDGVFKNSQDSDDFYDENTSFYRMEQTNFSHEKIQEYLQFKQTKYLHTIKNCVVFFTVITAISLSIWAIILLESL